MAEDASRSTPKRTPGGQNRWLYEGSGRILAFSSFRPSCANVGLSGAAWGRPWGPVELFGGGLGGLWGRIGASDSRKDENAKILPKPTTNERFWPAGALFGVLLEAS